jgi:para-aminobenzoate synthetase/4-amino-4-deoxychorismate lyase
MEPISPDTFSVLVRDAADGSWLRFARPDALMMAHRAEDVAAVMERADAALAAGYHVAGFVAYEAAPGFDSSLVVRDAGDFPRAALGVFGAPESVPPPPPPQPGPEPLIGRLAPSVSEAGFTRDIARIREAIREGDTYQVNYTYRLAGPLRGDPWDLFRHLVHAQAATYAAWVVAGRWVVASASPELFFRRDGDRIVSRPMKGTAARSRPGSLDAARLRDLLDSGKERAENLMIVDMVRNDLSRIAEPRSVAVEELFVPEAYPTVWQLTSLVSARSRASLGSLFAAMFPAASITGAPRSSTTAIIARMETTPRRVYTGSIGFARPDGSAQFNVAIRTALVDRSTGRIEYGVGGGIVWDSDAAREWKETRAKSSILHLPLPDFRLLETLKWTPGSGFALFDDHVARLVASARVLGFRVEKRRVVQTLVEAARRFERRPGRVRLTVDRDGACSLEVHRLDRSRRFTRPRLAVAPAAVASVDPFLRHKTTRREVYDRMLALCPGEDDVLLWNERGELTESCFANLFMERDGLLLTPPARSGLLPGTLRGRLLADGRAVEAVLTPADLADGRVVLGNSVRGLYAAASVTDRRVGRPLEV